MDTYQKDYPWLQEFGNKGKSYSMWLGNYLAHNYVEKHTLDEIKNTPYIEVARQMHKKMSEYDRCYIKRDFKDNLHCVRQDRMEALIGIEALLKAYVQFIEDHINKNLEKYHGVVSSERFYENVPYENRVIAARCGGKWDPDARMWWFPTEEQRVKYNHSAP